LLLMFIFLKSTAFTVIVSLYPQVSDKASATWTDNTTSVHRPLLSESLRLV
jgi:hypothetical protein